MRPPFEKVSMEKESVVKCSYDSRFFKVSIQRLCQSYQVQRPVGSFSNFNINNSMC